MNRMIATDLYIEEIPMIYAEFESLIGQAHWQRRVKKLETDFANKPFLKEFIVEENSLAYKLHDCEKYARGGWRIDQTHARGVYSAISFAAQTLSIVIDGNITVTVLVCDRGQVRIGIEAPKDVNVARSELLGHRRYNSYRDEFARKTK